MVRASMVNESLIRLSEHLHRCSTALTNVGADGINQLQMHLRLAFEWACILGTDIEQDNTRNEGEKDILRALVKLIIGLNHTEVFKLPAAVEGAYGNIKAILYK